jgi:hypothetical protein
MQRISMGAAKALFCRNIMEACEAREHGGDSKKNHQVEGAIMQAKEWTRMFGRCNPMEHAVTKQQSRMAPRTVGTGRPAYPLYKHPGAPLSAGKSPIQLFVRVLKFVVQYHLRLSHPSRLFGSTKHILIPLKVHTPK